MLSEMSFIPLSHPFVQPWGVSFMNSRHTGESSWVYIARSVSAPVSNALFIAVEVLRVSIIPWHERQLGL